LVTGSSSGIGAAIVRQFATQDYDAVVHYNAGEERAAQIPYMRGQLIAVDGGFTLPGNRSA